MKEGIILICVFAAIAVVINVVLDAFIVSKGLGDKKYKITCCLVTIFFAVAMFICCL